MIKLKDVSTDGICPQNDDTFYRDLKPHCNALLDAAEMLCSNKINNDLRIDKEHTLLTKSKLIENLCHDYLISKGKSRLSFDYIKSLVSLEIVKEDYGYRFVFGQLFPSRGNIINKSVLKGYLRTLDYGFMPVIAEKIDQLKREDKVFFDERVAVEVIHFYADERQLKDYDNVESKPIIDMIMHHFIKDDSPQYMSLHYNYKLSDKPHSELLIIPESKYYELKSTSAI